MITITTDAFNTFLMLPPSSYRPIADYGCLSRRALVIQNIRHETLGNFEAQLAADRYSIEVLDAHEENLAVEPSCYDMIIILGGPMAVYDDLPFLNQEMILIQRAVAKHVPVLGVCLGSQLIAQASGGRVYRGRAKEIGWNSVRITKEGKDGLFAGLEDPLSVFQWHGDTYELPPSAGVLAYSDKYPQAFQIGSAFGVQFHVEVNESLIRSWTEEYSSEVKSEKLDPEKILGNPQLVERLSTTCTRLYRNFVKIAGIPQGNPHIRKV